MADLSAYISYSVTLDNTGDTPVVTIQDTTTFPEGLDVTITSYVVTIVQPDGISASVNLVEEGSVVVKNILLRLANDGNFQNGTYVANAVVEADGYDNTIKNYLFRLSYAKPVEEVLPKIDVFTPNIKVYDATNYNPVGLTLNSVTRAYTGIINSVSGTSETVTGTAQMFDLVYSGHYYDAQYVVTLVATFQNTTSDSLVVKDKITTNIQFDAYTPSTLSELLTGLNNLKQTSSYGCCDKYTKAVALYDQIVAQGTQGNTVGLQVYVIQLENMIAGFSLTRTHTDAIIPTYVFSANTSSSSINLPNGTSSWSVPYSLLLDSILIVAPTATTVTIGSTPGGTDISDAQSIDAGGYYIVTVNRPYTTGNTIYFGGILSDTEITIFKK